MTARQYNSDTSHPYAGAALVLAAALGFSAKAVLVKLVYAEVRDIDPVTIMAGRMLFGLPCFLVAAVWSARRSRTRHKQPLSSRDWCTVAALGITGYYLSTLLDTMGLAYISAGMERLILFVYPTLVVVFGALFFGQRITTPVILALALTYGGVALAASNMEGGANSNLILGGGLVFAAAVTFAVFTVASHRVMGRLGATRFTAYAMSISGMATATHYLFSGAPSIFWLSERALLLCFVMAVGTTVIPVFMLAAGIRMLGPGPAAIISSVGPVATLGMAYAILGEAVTPIQGAGTALVLAGVLAVGKGKEG
ncbi:MAG: DMT family transporter [Leptospirillia bacterium]